jgi:predicted Ser/Thr protein kinase
MNGQGPLPDRLGDYRVLRRLGEGGMGVVYLATSPQGHDVAVKALRHPIAAEPNARRRLAREVETMRRVHSPFVAEVLDADVSCEQPYIVTRYVNGRTLEDMVSESGPLSGEALARVAYGLASALTAVHAAGVVHRDLKPGNVMLADGRPVVIDFGIAQAPDLTRLTMTGMFMGTPGYLAPEVIEGKPSATAADVHSWGATLAFAATGRPPFGIGSFESIFYRIVHGQPDLDRFPVSLAPMVMHALARDPARRPSAAELTARLAALDPASLVPGPAGGAGPGLRSTAAPGTIADQPGAAGWGQAAGVAGGALAGAGQGPGQGGGAGAFGAGPAAYPAGFGAGGAGAGGAWGPAQAGAAGSGVAAGPGVAAGGVGLSSHTQPLVAGGGVRPADDYRDILPDVRYGQPGYPPAGWSAPPGTAPPGGWPGAGPGADPAGLGRSNGSGGTMPPGPATRAVGRSGPVLAVAVVLVIASIGVLLPVAGLLLGLIALLVLRSAGMAGVSMSKRRTARGSRPSDPMVAALFFPGALLRSLIRLVLMAPLALVVGGFVAAVTVVGRPAHPVAQAGAYAAGAIVLFYGLGPGSSSTRRPLVRFFNALGRTPVSGAILFTGILALAIGAVVAAASHPAAYWPVSNVPFQLQHTPRMHGLLRDLRIEAFRLIGKQA